jgi:hypothetical protein
MLRLLLSWAGRRIGAAVALLYFAGLIAPALALAITNGAVSAYCFDEIAEQIAVAQPASPVQAHVHVHADGTVHQHADHDQQAAHEHHDTGPGAPHHHEHSHDADCCGAFGFSAVLPGLTGVVRESRLLLTHRPMLMNRIDGCGQARIDRPPILL